MGSNKLIELFEQPDKKKKLHFCFLCLLKALAAAQALLKFKNQSEDGKIKSDFGWSNKNEGSFRIFFLLNFWFLRFLHFFLSVVGSRRRSSIAEVGAIAAGGGATVAAGEEVGGVPAGGDGGGRLLDHPRCWQHRGVVARPCQFARYFISGKCHYNTNLSIHHPPVHRIYHSATAEW